jgi:hypothetical protein
MGGIEKHIYHIGHGAELLVMEELRQLGWAVNFMGTYYDIKATKGDVTKLIEVKCTNFIVKNGHQVTMYGRFDFTDNRNVKKQRTNNVDVCFVVCIGDNYQVLGLMKAKTLKVKRYVSLLHVMNKARLKNIDNWSKQNE